MVSTERKNVSNKFSPGKIIPIYERIVNFKKLFIFSITSSKFV